MKLTDKAKEDFLDYLRNNKKASLEIGVLRLHWQEYPKEYLNALIIEWLDSVQLQITIFCFDLNKYSINILKQGRYMYNIEKTYKNRNEATEYSIEKANEIYNLL